MLKKKVLSLVMLTMLINVSGVQATTCEESLTLCDRYVKDLEEERNLCRGLVNEQNVELSKCKYTAAKPWYQDFLLGLALGLVSGFVIERISK